MSHPRLRGFIPPGHGEGCADDLVNHLTDKTGLSMATRGILVSIMSARSHRFGDPSCIVEAEIQNFFPLWEK